MTTSLSRCNGYTEDQVRPSIVRRDVYSSRDWLDKDIGVLICCFQSMKILEKNLRFLRIIPARWNEDGITFDNRRRRNERIIITLVNKILVQLLDILLLFHRRVDQRSTI